MTIKWLSRIWRRKSAEHKRKGPQLARHLTAINLVPIGVGSTIGAGVYVLVGTVAREQVGPALPYSFLIAGIAAALSALCYAELASRCPSAGSAYHYAYTCVGEGLAWIIGWALILENTIGGSAVARGIAPNLAILCGGAENLPAWLLRREVSGIVIDPCAGLLVLIAAALLCTGIRESARMQAIMTVVNVSVLLFVVAAGSFIGFKSGWQGYHSRDGYLPYGLSGVIRGAGTLFFAFIGFDTVASTAEEVKDPRRDLPIGIALTLLITSIVYMLVSSVVVGIVPYYLIDPDTPMSTIFASNGMPWAMYVVTCGAVAALSTTLLGSILPQPRILMSMARDGLLPGFFSRVNKTSKVPVNGTLVTGLAASALAFTMEVDVLAGMVSVGTLLSFTIVGISILVLRYTPPMEPPISLHSATRVHKHSNQPQTSANNAPSTEVTCSLLVYLPKCLENYDSDSDSSSESSSEDIIGVPSKVYEEENQQPLLNSSLKIVDLEETLTEQSRRRTAALSIGAVCAGALFTSVAVSFSFNSYLKWGMTGLGALAFVAGFLVLIMIDQDEGRHKFGSAGGFQCPWVPAVPVLSLLVNAYLLVNLGGGTWMRVSVWLTLGVIVYATYGIHKSVLNKGDEKASLQSDLT